MTHRAVCWQPAWNPLEESEVILLLVNTVYIKAVPGRNTDVRDYERIADLIHCRLLRGSYVPDRSQRKPRELILNRANRIRERSSEVNRLPRVLERATIKSAAASDVIGKAVREIRAALVAGITDPAALTWLAKGTL